MKAVRLTSQARDRLVEIARWTIEKFGHDQAARYEQALVTRLRSLGAGDWPRGPFM